MSKKLNILFIVPPNISFDSFTKPPKNVKAKKNNGKKELGVLVTDMPLGPLTLSAYLKKNMNITTALLDFNIELNKVDNFEFNSFEAFFEEKINDFLKNKFTPDIVGLSVLFGTAYQSMLSLASICRNFLSSSIVIGGGFLPTNMYAQIYEDSDAFHALCFGEGEKPLLRLALSDNKLDFLKNDSSWITKEKARASGRAGKGIISLGKKNIKIQEFSHDLIENLDDVPVLDYEICDLKGYSLNPTVNAYPALVKEGLPFNIMTSRGCPYSCSFCAQDTVHGKKMRYQSLLRLKEDLMILKNKYSVKTVVIEDDHFMGDVKRAYEILGLLMELDMKACFPNALALYALKKPMLQRIKNVGVNQLVLAVESGSYEVLHKIMRKPLNLEIVKRVTKDCREIGIYTDCNLVIGQPGETVEHFEQSRKFLKSIYANWFRPNVATPVTGSELLSKAVDGGYLKGEFTHCDYKKAIIETEDFTDRGLQSIAYLFNLELNFVYNSDMRLGDYKTALLGFKNALQAKPDHYFAHKFASICYSEINQMDLADFHNDQASQAYRQQYWKDWNHLIDLPLSEIARL